MNRHISLIILFSFIRFLLVSQPDRWQQRVDYKMEIDFDVNKNQYSGIQKLTYYNNSPDELDRVFYHLYFNTFQPGSTMDIRSLNLPDPDGRVRDRISKLTESEIGYQHILSLKQDGVPLQYKIEGTILEVKLNKPIKPKGKAVFDMQFEAQVPIQIRRSGRNNKEGIAFSKGDVREV